MSLFDPALYAKGCPIDKIARLRNASAVSWQGPALDTTSPFPLHGGWWNRWYRAARV